MSRGLDDILGPLYELLRRVWSLFMPCYAESLSALGGRDLGIGFRPGVLYDGEGLEIQAEVLA